MAYFVGLFTPSTYTAFSKSDRTVCGVTENQRKAANKVSAGDKFICYMTKFGRWCAVLDVVDGPFVDTTPIFAPDNDPYTLRFHVSPRVVLTSTRAVPIRDDSVWPNLSFTRNEDMKTSRWTGPLRSSLGALSGADGAFLEQLLMRQSLDTGLDYPLDPKEWERALRVSTMRRVDQDVPVSLPDESDAVDAPEETEAGSRESHRMQALLADIGARLGMSIWIPRNDRQAVARERKFDADSVMGRLPLNYNDATLKTIENIDVLWVQRNAIARAFEVEHTTSIYSGILRMADLVALQPNIDIKLHIVAPASKKDRVFREIQRPVFSVIGARRLSEMCTFLSYESLNNIAAEKHLKHMHASIVDDYAEPAQ